MIKINRRLKKWVMPAIYSLAVIIALGGIFILNSAVKNVFEIPTEIDQVMNVMLSEEQPVMKPTDEIIVKPYLSDKINVDISYYQKDDSVDIQQKSIVFYQDTYMPSTGIFYSGPELFDVISILDGKVIEIKEDNLLGNVIIIEHTNDIMANYQCLGDIHVKVHDEVKNGDAIATSGTCTISTKDNNLVFETFKSGKLINPTNLFDKAAKDL